MSRPVPTITCKHSQTCDFFLQEARSEVADFIKARGTELSQRLTPLGACILNTQEALQLVLKDPASLQELQQLLLNRDPFFASVSAQVSPLM